MNNIIKQGTIENYINSMEIVGYSESKKISNRIVSKIIANIINGEFNDFGRVLEYKIDTESITTPKMFNNSLVDIETKFIVLKDTDGKIGIASVCDNNDIYTSKNRQKLCLHKW